MSQYNKLSNFEYARFQILAMHLLSQLLLSAGIFTLLGYHVTSLLDVPLIMMILDHIMRQMR